MACSGTFAYGNNPLHIWVALSFGLSGYAMDKTGLPPGPLILAPVFGPMIEIGYEQSLSMSMALTSFS